MNKYYEYRKAIRTLYDNDTLIGDLCCKVLEIRDKYRFVESITTEIQNYSIEVEVSEGTTDEDKGKVINKIASAIGYFISDNTYTLPPEIRNDPEFDMIIESDNFIYCDISMVGNSIKFLL